jgi:hypothetical protein
MIAIFRVLIVIVTFVQVILIILAFVGSYKNSTGLNNSYLLDVHLNRLNLTTLFDISANSTKSALGFDLDSIKGKDVADGKVHDGLVFIPTKTTTLPTGTTEKDFFGAINSIATAAATAAIELVDGIYTTVSDVFLNIATLLTYSDLGLAQVYSFSNWGYCRGYKIKDHTIENSGNADWDNNHINWTYCTPPKANYLVDPLTILKQEVINIINSDVQGGIDIPILSDAVISELKVLVNNVSYDDFHLPGTIQEKLGNLHAASTAGFVLLILAMAFGLINFAIQTLAIFMSPNSTCLTVADFMLQVVVFLLTLITSAIITATNIYVRNQINDYTPTAGMRSFLSTNLYAYLWTATVASLLVVILSLLGYFFGFFGTRNRTEKYNMTTDVNDTFLEKN